MSNGYAAKVALQKKMDAEKKRSWIAHKQLVREAGSVSVSGYERELRAAEKESRRRAGTLDRQEKRARYGRWNPASGTCDECFQLKSASGQCSCVGRD